MPTKPCPLSTSNSNSPLYTELISRVGAKLTWCSRTCTPTPSSETEEEEGGSDVEELDKADNAEEEAPCVSACLACS